MASKTTQHWTNLAERRLRRHIRLAHSIPTLSRLGPKATPWMATVKFVNRPTMTRLNQTYRAKKYPTDILSFPALSPFRATGLLGELVICFPVLKSQAKDVGHGPEKELDVLLVHGLLHLLGLDHEISHAEATRMARWEARLLASSVRAPRNVSFGLIRRADSGI